MVKVVNLVKNDVEEYPTVDAAKAAMLERFPGCRMRRRNVFGAKCIGVYDPNHSVALGAYRAFIVVEPGR